LKNLHGVTQRIHRETQRAVKAKKAVEAVEAVEAIKETGNN